MERIFNIEPGQRSAKAVQLLYNSFKHLTFFVNVIKQYGMSTALQCCQWLSQETVSETVFKQGDAGDKFYIIWSGSVGVFVGEKEVAVLKKGDSFGELALMNDAPRTATIICKDEMVTMLTLQRKHYQDILKQLALAEHQRDLSFLSSVQLFSQLRKRTIETLLYHFKRQKVFKDQVIYSEDDQPDNIYLICDGEISLKKNFKQQEPQNYYMRLKKQRMDIRVALLSVGEIFGEVECLAQQTRNFTAQCESVNGELFVINKVDFIRRLIDENEDITIKVFLNNYIGAKINWRNQAILRILTTLSHVKRESPSPEREELNISQTQVNLTSDESSLRVTSKYKSELLLNSLSSKITSTILNGKKRAKRKMLDFEMEEIQIPLHVKMKFKKNEAMQSFLPSVEHTVAERVLQYKRRITPKPKKVERYHSPQPIQTLCFYKNRKRQRDRQLAMIQRTEVSCDT